MVNGDALKEEEEDDEDDATSANVGNVVAAAVVLGFIVINGANDGSGSVIVGRQHCARVHAERMTG